jgi:hypothetical protein
VVGDRGDRFVDRGLRVIASENCAPWRTQAPTTAREPYMLSPRTRIVACALTARAVPIAWATIRPAPLPEPARPARSFIPAITGAATGVLIVVANGEPLAQDLCAGDLGVPVGGALFGVPIHRAQQRTARSGEADQAT